MPTKLAAYLRTVEGVASIMAGAILDVLHQGLRFAEVVENGLNDFQIRLRSTRGNVVNLAGFSFLKHQRDRTAIVFDEKPIALLHAIAVDRQSFVFLRVGNDQRNQFLGKLERAVVVGATENDCGDAIGIGICRHEMVRGSLAGGIRTPRVEDGFFREAAAGRRASINFVRADVDESREFTCPGSFEQALRTRNVGAKEGRSIFNAAVDMGFGGEIDKRVKAAFENIGDRLGIADVAANKVVTRVRGQVAQALRVSGVGQLVEIDDVYIAASAQNVSNEIRADESCPACHQEFQSNSPSDSPETRSSEQALRVVTPNCGSVAQGFLCRGSCWPLFRKPCWWHAAGIRTCLRQSTSRPVCYASACVPADTYCSRR